MSKFIVLSLGVLIGLLILFTAAAAPLVESSGAEPEIFEVAGKTCIYFKGVLECNCPCGTGGCGEANLITIPETWVSTVPQPITVTVQIAPAAVGSTEPAGDETAAPGRWDPYAPITGVEPAPEQEWNPVGLPVLEPGQAESPGDNDNSGNGRDRDKPPCNQGVGNGAEGCDPGNSNNNQESNDEGPGKEPGSPGRAHNDNGGGNSGNRGRGDDN